MGLFAEGWNVAYRNKATGTILSDDSTEFTVIKNTWRTWCADPFVFEYDGETYIFAEIFDYFKNYAGIGYCKYDKYKKSFSKWKLVIEENFHMSYPFIFAKDGDVYMMPETSENKSLIIYKAINFPDIWERYNDVLNDVSVVDTTIDNPCQNVSLGLTYEIKDSSKWELKIFELNNGKITWGKNNPVSTDEEFARPGGYFFDYDGKSIRVSQDCLKSYGYALNFFEILDFSLDNLSEKLVKKISPEDISLDKSMKITGVHTYNSSKNFEVVDVKSYMHNFVYVLLRLLRKIKRIVKRG